MAWANLDDGFPDHPKVIAAGALCELLQIRAICYCTRYLTDGFIPAQAVTLLLTGFAELGIVDDGRLAPALSADWPARMVAAGLWHRRKSGYLLHDFLDWNRSKKEVKTLREQKRQAGQKGAKSRWNKPETSIAAAIAAAIAPAMDKRMPHSTPLRTTPASLPGEIPPTPPATHARTDSNGSHDPGSTDRTAASPTALGEIIARGSETVNRRTAERVAELRRQEGKA